MAFFKYNWQIIEELNKSRCKKYKISGSWNLKTWYTMTLWENENEINDFSRKGTHLQAMKNSKKISSRIQSHRVHREDLLSWKEAKNLLTNHA